MNLFFKDVLGILRVFEATYERIRKILIPPKAFSWQTLIYLSIFSWLMSYFSTGIAKDLIALCGWLFLIAGTAWYTTDDPLKIPSTNLPLGAIITGFLVSVFAFGHEQEIITSRTIVLWPTISAIITAIPEFVEGTGTEAATQIPKPEKRQQIILLLGCCAVLSCWLQLYFTIDHWLQEYPSLLADNFKRSTFVVRTEDQLKIPKNGALILDRLAPRIEEQLSDARWSDAEKWLLDADKRVTTLGSEIIQKNLKNYDEKTLWRVEPRIQNVNSGYRLDLLSVWNGPSSNPRGYYLKKSCRIDPIAGSPNPDRPQDRTTVAEVKCDRVNTFVAGDPPAK